jgi:hypothetical protein
MTDKFDEVIGILRSSNRSTQQVSILNQKFGKIDFFRQYSNKNQNSIVLEMLNKINLEQCAALSIVFQKGDIANKFYILQEGEVAVFLDIDKNNFSGIKKCPYPELKKRYYDDPSFFDQTTHRFLKMRVSVLNEGQSFGELGVLNGQPRMATVIATKPCKFGVLCTEDFMSTLQPSFVKNAEQKINFFKCLFDKSSYFDELWRLTTFFHHIKFEKNQIIATEDSDFNRVFIIAEGLVQLEKSLTLREINQNYYSHFSVKENHNLSNCNKKHFPEITSSQNNNNSLPKQILRKNEPLRINTDVEGMSWHNDFSANPRKVSCALSRLSFTE